MHADEVATSVTVVRRLLETQFPELAARPIHVVTSRGTDHALYRIGRDLVARLPRREVNVESLEKERRWLPRLAPHLPLDVPLPVADGQPGEGYPFAWSIYRWLDGQPAYRERPADSAQAARELASFVGALQRIDPTDGPPPGAHNVFRGEPLDRRDTRTRAAVDVLAGTLDADAVLTIWRRALEAPAWDGAPAWIHGDLDARNLLVTDGRLTGVIDFGCLGVGDPACDVMVAWKMLPANAREIIRTALDVDDATWERARGWALSQAVTALSYYTLETNPVLVNEAQHWLRELLRD
jgi:aminoglycoside phosphotransferase (APT) family kinase protein